MESTTDRTTSYRTEMTIAFGAILIYGLWPSQNNNYADDSLHWAFLLTLPSGLINSHHLYLNAARWVYHDVLGDAVDPAALLAAYSALLGTLGLIFFYKLANLLGCRSVALTGTILCAVTLNYWAYSTVGDVYIPATALLVFGSYAFLRSLRSSSNRRRALWMSTAVIAFVLMVLHHQAYAIFVVCFTVATLITHQSIFSRRLANGIIVSAATGLLCLAIYGLAYRATQDFGTKSFASFVSGYAQSFEARPDQRMLSAATLLNSAAGQLRAVVPYFVVFRSERLARAIQNRFPYRNVYPYPYLVSSLGPLEIAVIVLSIALACTGLVVLVARGVGSAFHSRDATLAFVLAAIPTGLFFIWWEGISDEFWIWSLPLIALIASKGALAGSGGYVKLLKITAAALFASSLLGAIQLFVDPSNDIDAVNRRYLARLESPDLLIGFDEIQSSARVRIARSKIGFSYFNVHGRATNWTTSDLAELKDEISDALNRGGRIFVDPYVLEPPKSNLALIELRNPGFTADRLDLIEYLRLVDPGRIVWVKPVATVPGYFLEAQVASKRPIQESVSDRPQMATRSVHALHPCGSTVDPRSPSAKRRMRS